MRVRFIKPYCAYGVGADPVLDAIVVERLIAMGVCEPYDKPAPKPAPVVVIENQAVELGTDQGPVTYTPPEPAAPEETEPPAVAKTRGIRRRG